RLDALVRDHLLAEVREQRLAVRGAAGELVAVPLVAHGLEEGTESSVLAQVEPAPLERLDHLVDRLLAEVRDRVELVLGLRYQVADRLDAGALEAVVRAPAQLQLLDQDVVHRVRRPAARPGAGARPRDPADEALF